MSVALELEYEAFYPRLRVVPEPAGALWTPRRGYSAGGLILGAVAVVLLVLLVLPIRALGGKTIAGAGPAAGQEYVVRSGDTLASIATRVDGTMWPAWSSDWPTRLGSTVLVPGEHLLIP